MKSLVVGLSFGQLYKDVLLKMGHEVITVDNDPNKQADFLELTTALATHSPFDTAHICVPNYLHYKTCLLYTSPSPRDATLSRMPSSA